MTLYQWLLLIRLWVNTSLTNIIEKRSVAHQACGKCYATGPGEQILFALLTYIKPLPSLPLYTCT